MTVNLIMNVASVLLGAAAVVMSARYALPSIGLAFLCGLVTSTASRMNITIVREEEQHGHIDPD